jgi:hypothetical protein
MIDPTVLYDHPDSQAADVPDRSARVPDLLADTPTPDETARAFYGDSLITSVFDRRGPELFDAAGLDEDTREDVKQDFLHIADSTGLPDSVVATLAGAFIDGELAAARTEDPDKRLDALNRACDQSNEELRAGMRARYGVKEAEDLLGRVQRFCRQNPTLSRVLQSHGLGSKRDIVEAIAAHVHSTGWR